MSKIAFFDVDETLIKHKSMFIFLEFYLKETNKRLKGLTYQQILSQIRMKIAKGNNRLDINRLYYQLFEGQKQEEIQSYTVKYFNKFKDAIFKDKVLARLENHKKNNEEVVLVSGSMPDIIKPIVNYINIDQFLCSVPEVKNGKYTGKLLQQSIGEYKAMLIKKYASTLGVSLIKCYAYGDHISDITMLESVGYPCVVDPEDDFKKIAERRKWEII